MSTLITVGNSDGERRCDARCYDATEPECDCVCGGINHGKGFNVASQNTHELAKKIKEDYEETHPGTEVKIERVIQTRLFS